jgi:hypothetical protein
MVKSVTAEVLDRSRPAYLRETLTLLKAARRAHKDIYFVLVQDSLEGPLGPLALIAVTS